MPITMSLVKKLEAVEPQLRSVLFALIEEVERQGVETVKKSDFDELRAIVAKLAEAQQRTEAAINGLAAAQQRTDKAISALEKTVAELVEAQKRTDKTVSELVEAQKRTDKTVAGLVEGQKRTDKALAELAAAQTRTEQALAALTSEHAKTRKHLGGLSHAVGYVLEDRAYKFLPALLKRDFGIEVKGKLTRNFIKDKNGKDIEVNIIGQASRNGEQFTIVGECKSQLSKSRVAEFLDKKFSRLAASSQTELFPILVTYMKTTPDVDDFARQRGIKRVYYSYEFDLD